MNADRAMPLPSTLAHPDPLGAWARRELLPRLYEDEQPEALDYATPIFDQLVLDRLARASRPSLARRMADSALVRIAAALAVAVLACWWLA